MPTIFFKYIFLPVWSDQFEYPGSVLNFLCNFVIFEAAALHAMPVESQYAVGQTY